MEHKLVAVWTRDTREGYKPWVEMVCMCGWSQVRDVGSLPARAWNEHIERWRD